MRNVLAKVPKGSAEMVAAAIRTVFAQPDAAGVADQLDSIATKLGRQFPDVETMLRDAGPDICAFAAFPQDHWRKVWSTNPLERVNREIKRRTDVVGIFPTRPPFCAWPPRCCWVGGARRVGRGRAALPVGGLDGEALTRPTTMEPSERRWGRRPRSCSLPDEQLCDAEDQVGLISDHSTGHGQKPPADFLSGT